MVKKALAALGIGMIATAAALTIAFGTGQPARADNKYGGAGPTITQSAAPTTPAVPSASPTLKVGEGWDQGWYASHKNA